MLLCSSICLSSHCPVNRLVCRGSVASAYIRCRMTVSLRATGTRTGAMPQRLPQAPEARPFLRAQAQRMRGLVEGRGDVAVSAEFALDARFAGLIAPTSVPYARPRREELNPLSNDTEGPEQPLGHRHRLVVGAVNSSPAASTEPADRRLDTGVDIFAHGLWVTPRPPRNGDD